jgi:acyl carrier protein
MVERPMQQTRERLISLVEQLLARPLDGEYALEQRLSDLGLSSIKMVSLMLAIEAEFQVMIGQSDITPENFHSIIAIESLLLRLQTAAASA